MPPKTAPTTRARAEHLGPERRRPQVLDTALEIAAEHGVANVTMALVAERMEVTRPVVYACYSGRGECGGDGHRSNETAAMTAEMHCGIAPLMSQTVARKAR